MRRICIFLFVLCGLSLYGQRLPGLWRNNSEPSATVEVRSASLGVLFSRMSDAEIAAMKNPEAGLLVYSTTSGCLKRYNDVAKSWNCILGGSDIKVLDPRARDVLPPPKDGTTKLVYNTDTKCMEAYKPEGGWQCSYKNKRKEKTAFFTRELYPVMGTVDKDGRVLSGRGLFSVKRIATGEYRVKLGDTQTLLSVTANDATMGQHEAEAPSLIF